MKFAYTLLALGITAALCACTQNEVDETPIIEPPVEQVDTPEVPDKEPEDPYSEIAAIYDTQAPNFYSDEWYVDWGWSGEYPPGFSVIRENVTVPARTQPDPDMAHDMTCALPYLAGFHQWNDDRNAAHNAVYMTATKGFYFTVKEAGTLPIYEPDSETEVTLAVGEKIKFDRYLSEGWFIATYKDNTMRITEGDLPPVSPDEWPDLVEDKWFALDCGEGRGWLKLDEVYKERGIGANSMQGFGKATDLTEEEAATARGYED